MKFLLKLLMLISRNTLRLMLIQIVGLNLVLAANTNSQDLSKVKVSLNVSGASLTTVFREIEQKTNFVFAYTDKIASVDRTFNLKYSRTSLRKILEDIANEANIEFKRINNTISVTPHERIVPVKVPDPVVLIPVSGRVLDETGSGLPGVNVLEKGTSNGTTTDMNGDFTLDVSGENSVLVFSFIGYETLEQTVGTQTSLSVTLNPDITQMEEIVVIGYQTIEKKDLTGAVSVVNAEHTRRLSVNTVAESLQGLAAGVTVRNTGSPGASAKIDIRGTGTFGANEPLYVIDGMLSTATPDFNPNDIETFQILKDASAAAIYGSRAANGVVIITTKKGRKGGMQVSASVRTGVQQFHKRWDLMNSQEFAELNRVAYQNSGLTPQTSVDAEFDPSIDTDWQEEVMRTGSIQDYNLTLSGGGESATYLISGNFFSNKGTIIDNSFDRANLRLNTTASRGRFRFEENLLLSYARTDLMEGNPFIDMVRMLPTMPVQGSRYIAANNPEGWAIGDEVYANTFGTNTVAQQRLSQRNQHNYKLRGNAFAEVDIVEGLTYKFNVGMEASFDNFKGFRRPGVIRKGTPDVLATADENRAQFLSFLYENTVNYSRKIGSHSIAAVAGMSNQTFRHEQLYGQKQNLPISTGSGDYFTVLNQGNNPTVGSFINEWAILGYFGRLNYAFADKYIFSGTIRRDADTRFGENYRWGTFSSASVAWRISEENFYDIPWLSDLKVRASYGELGNSEILGPWQYYGTISPFPRAVFGVSETVYPGAINIRLANKDLRWEEKRTTDIGLDASLWEDKLTFTVDYFFTETRDVLTELPIPLTTGNAGGNPAVNAASLRNTGVEFTTTYFQRGKKFNWDLTLNLTRVRNKVLDLGNIGAGKTYIQLGDARTELGRAMGEWYVLKTDGIFQNQEEIDAHMIQPWASPGDIRYVDATGDGVLNVDTDRVYAGSPWPKLQAGLVWNGYYKNFTFSMQWYGVFGNTLYNRPRYWLDRFDENAAYRSDIDPWTEQDPNNHTPRIGISNGDQGLQYNARPDTDRWLESGSYVRLRNVEIGYNIPNGTLSKLGVKNSRIYVSGQNLLTFTGYSGLDPDVTGVNIFERGLDNGQYPALRMYSVGIQLGF
jgi:TonB-dependent starch-binding outer membrane protein SusC